MYFKNIYIYTMGFLEGLWKITWVFRWPKPLFFHGFGAHGIFISYMYKYNPFFFTPSMTGYVFTFGPCFTSESPHAQLTANGIDASVVLFIKPFLEKDLAPGCFVGFLWEMEY